MNKRLLLIENTIVIAVIEIPVNQDNITPDDYEGYYDTVVRDDKLLYNIGEVYHCDEFDRRDYETLTVAEKRNKMSMTNQQADIALIIYGLKDLAYSKVKTEGSRRLRTLWGIRPDMQFTRLCAETLEMMQLGGVSESVTDELFLLGAKINPLDLDGSLSTEQLKIVDAYYDNEQRLKSFEESVKTLTGDAPQAEIWSWETQRREAVGWLKDDTINTPYIDSLIISRNKNETKQQLCEKIVTKSTMYEQKHAELLGGYQSSIK